MSRSVLTSEIYASPFDKEVMRGVLGILGTHWPLDGQGRQLVRSELQTNRSVVACYLSQRARE